VGPRSHKASEDVALDHPLGARWLAEVDSLVGLIRGPRVERFSIEKVASRTEVSISFKEMHPRVHGLTLRDGQVVLNRDLRGALANFTFAHELAHVLRRRGRFVGLRSSEEEWFADWFAREMLLPRAWLTLNLGAHDLAALHVDRMTAALQMAAIGRAPEIMRMGDRILCRVCGVHHHRWGCNCSVARSTPAFERRFLPEAPRFARAAPARPWLQMSMTVDGRCLHSGCQRTSGLVNREESSFKAATCHAQVEAPDADPFRAG
jgi:hypothetical protein